MRRVWVGFAFGLLASAALAQDMATASGAQMRFLDKLTGAVTDLDMASGQSATLGRLTIQMNECRYPADNQTAEALALVTVIDAAAPDPVFNGWMVASSPALSALDHPRYDVWVLRCDIAELALPAVEDAPVEGDVPVDEAAPTDGQ